MRKKVTFICGGELVPSSRFRVHPIAKALESDGWQTEIIHGYGRVDQKIQSPILRRGYRAMCRGRRAVRTAFIDCDGPVMVQRLALPWVATPELCLGRKNRGLVFDFDDAVFLGSDGSENRFRRKALNAVFEKSAHVVAGNSWLAQQVTADVPTTVIPTCIDTSLYRPLDNRPQNERVHLGWVGTGSNFPNLWQLERPLATLRSNGHAFDFTICSDSFDRELNKRLGAAFKKWTPDTELPFLQSLDIGLMPLQNSDWNRGKCSFKMIQYMSVGCPTVASAVGMNADVLNGDVGGKLVYDEDWLSSLIPLIESSEKRIQASREARLRAVERYDVSVAVANYKTIFSTLQGY